MSEFFTKYKNKVVYTNPGTKTEPIYSYKYDKEGHKDLVISGEKDLDAEIQANKDYCSIAKMVERFSMGDENALDRVKGFYADFTEMLRSYAEMFQRVEDCYASFNSLDPDVKEVFGNDANVFWSSFGTGEFYERLGETKAEAIVAEVKEGEVE